MPRTVYFDYNATTPLDPAVRDAMLPFLGDVWGNPSSVHHVGRKARALLDDARGDWGNGTFYAGGYEVSYEPVVRGGKNFLQRARVGFQIEVSK